MKIFLTSLAVAIISLFIPNNVQASISSHAIRSSEIVKSEIIGKDISYRIYGDSVMKDEL